MGLAALRHVGSSRTRARTRVPCIGRRILNHCTTREDLCYCFLAAPPLSLHPLPSLISNCLNLPFGSQGRSWRLESVPYKQGTGDTERLPCPGAPTGSCSVSLRVHSLWHFREGHGSHVAPTFSFSPVPHKLGSRSCLWIR